MSEPQHRGTAPDSEPAAVDLMRAHLASLEDLPERPVVEHVERFAQVHAALHAALAEIDPAG